ncbi:MAG: serine/threonine protein kinase, partial [Anaerolineae bacterium]|nr:serine/threonine protein kinase [Anaerolineae bacterium]
MALPQTRTTSITRITDPRRLRLMRWAWVGLVIYNLAYYLANWVAWVGLRLGLIACTGACGAFDVSPQVLDQLSGIGLTSVAVALYRPVLDLLTSAVFMGVGLLIFRRRADDWMGFLSSLMLMYFGPRVVITVTRTLITLDPDLFSVIGFFSALGFFFTIHPTLYLFPNGKFVPRWSRWLLLAILVYEVSIRGFGVYFGDLSSRGSLVTILAGAGGFIALAGFGLQLVRLRFHATPIERQQSKWVVIGGAAAIASIVISNFFEVLLPTLSGPTLVILGFVVPLVYYGLALMLPLAFAFSMLRYRLWEADYVLNRSLVYGVLAVFLAVVFFAVLGVMQIIAGRVLPVEQTGTATVLGALVVGALYMPTRRRLARFIDKRVFGFRVELDELKRRQNETRERNDPTQASLPQGVFSGVTVGMWDLGGVLGRGGMSEVYLSLRRDGQTPVAVKVLPPEMAAKDEYVARFAREVSIMRGLEHPNIVRLLGDGEQDSLRYLAMEYVDGPTLHSLMKQREALSLAEVRQVITDLAAALDYAHGRGLVHRDIKPSNVLLRLEAAGMRAVLADFGIAHQPNNTQILTRDAIMGTLEYIAPEQIMSAREVDARADIYALGVVAYQMLTGKLPFEGNPAQLVYGHLNQPAPSPCDVVSGLPYSVGNAVVKA